MTFGEELCVWGGGTSLVGEHLAREHKVSMGVVELTGEAVVVTEGAGVGRGGGALRGEWKRKEGTLHI